MPVARPVVAVVVEQPVEMTTQPQLVTQGPTASDSVQVRRDVAGAEVLVRVEVEALAEVVVMSLVVLVVVLVLPQIPLRPVLA